MDLLLQVSEKELEEFPEPPVDHTDQDKPDRTSAQVELRAAIFHISCRLRLRPVQPQKLPRSRQLQSVSSPGTEGLQCNLQCDRQCDQAPCTHSYIGRSNVTSHLPIFLHC